MKQKQYPKISIITPSFNQGKFIERTIMSVLSQSYPNLEYIVIDGGSTDNTVAILNKYNKHLTWISKKDKGQAHAINKGINMSTGEIVAFLNSDDTYEPQALRKVADFFMKNDMVSFVYGIGHHIDENDLYINIYNSFMEYFDIDYITGTDLSLTSLYVGCTIPQPTTFWRKKIIKNVGLLNEHLHFAFDYDYWIRINKQYQLFYLPEHLANTRIHKHTKTSSQSIKVFRETAVVQLRHFGKVHYGIIFNIAELEAGKYEKQKFLSNAYHLLRRMMQAFTLFIRYNKRLPPLIMYRYFFAWVKEIFVRKNTVYDTILHIIAYVIATPYYLVVNRDELLNKFILIVVPKKYIELGRLQQHTPKTLTKIEIPEENPKKYYKISIVTPSYNQGQFIEKTIKSVLDQSYPAIEYIIQDGASTDDTKEIAKKYATKIHSFTSMKDKGQSNAINLGFEKSTGEIMAYLNSDDMMTKGSLQIINNFFQTHHDVDVVYGNRIIIDENDHEIGRWILYKHNDDILHYADYVPQETLFWRRRIWKKIGGSIDESFKFAMDWDLLMRFIQAKAKIVHLPFFIGMFRVHGSQKTSNQIHTTGKEESDRILSKYNEEINEKIRRQVMRNYVLRSALTSYLWDKNIILK